MEEGVETRDYYLLVTKTADTVRMWQETDLMETETKKKEVLVGKSLRKGLKRRREAQRRVSRVLQDPSRYDKKKISVTSY